MMQSENEKIWSSGNSGDAYYILNRYDSRIESIKDVDSWSDLCKRMSHEEPTIFCPALLGGGDYSGSGLVAETNFDAWCETFKDSEGIAWARLRGHHGSFGIAIDMSYRGEQFDEMQQFLSGLASCPCADDDLLSQKEMEAEGKAWENFIKRDFWRACCKQVFPDLDIEPDYNAERLFEVFEKARQLANEYWANEQGSDMWIDVEKIIPHISINDVFQCLNATGMQEIYNEMKEAGQKAQTEIETLENEKLDNFEAVADYLGITTQEVISLGIAESLKKYGKK